MSRESLDFGTMKVTHLFAKLFFPTFLGLFFYAMLNIADGMFVGQGVGSDALAAVNIAAPLYTLATAIGLQLASGVSIVAAVLLSQGKVAEARRHVTYAFLVGTATMAVICVLIWCLPRPLSFLFGGTEQLYPLVRDYMIWMAPALLFSAILVIGMFVLRLEGLPQKAMLCEVVPSIVNLVLDWLLVFPLQMGVRGAALATTLSQALGVGMLVYFMRRHVRTLRVSRLAWSRRAARLMVHDLWHMMQVGFPAFVGEIAISSIMVTGNYLFVRYLHEDGVAAFSVACYLMPLIFMMGSAIAQSLQPIVSYNMGGGHRDRVRQTLRISCVAALVSGLLVSALGFFAHRPLLALFLEPGSAAYTIATNGFPLYATSFLFFTLNLVLIGYLQSLKQHRLSTFFMLLRGFLFVMPSFVLLPRLCGAAGLWLAIPLSEMLTCVCLVVTLCFSRRVRVAKE
ncbi:MAG: MATE family efflux transporter [Bacteroidales bacterium]|nr:MATE family efflux transporter [Bacteroidales bacterium]